MEGAALPPTPMRAGDERGTPRFGAFSGELADASLTSLAGPWRRGRLYRLMHGKSWRWGMAGNDRVLVAFALVDASYAANAFVFAVDLAARRVLADRTALGTPLGVHVGDAPNEGTAARFAGGGMRMSLTRPRGEASYRVAIAARGLEVDLALESAGAPSPLVLVAPVPHGAVNVTQKSACLAARGSIAVDGRRYELANGHGGFDYTNGLIARHTAWRWAFATGQDVEGRPFALNLVAGFNEGGTASENVVWSAGAIALVPAVRFAIGAGAPPDEWRIASADGRVDLAFQPVHAHREDRDLVVARSRFLQAAGTFSGSLCGVRVSGVPGVA